MNPIRLQKDLTDETSIRFIEINPSAPIEMALGKGCVITSLILLNSAIVTKT